MRSLAIAMLLSLLVAGCTVGKEMTFMVDNRSGQPLRATFTPTIDGEALAAETFDVPHDAFGTRDFKGKVGVVKLSFVPVSAPGAAPRVSEATIETRTCPVAGLAFIVSPDLSVDPAHRC